MKKHVTSPNKLLVKNRRSSSRNHATR